MKTGRAPESLDDIRKPGMVLTPPPEKSGGRMKVSSAVWLAGSAAALVLRRNSIVILNLRSGMSMEIISSPILLMFSSCLEDQKWVWKLDTKSVAKDAHHHTVYQDERIHPKNDRH